jgi:hypothetical protein
MFTAYCLSHEKHMNTNCKLNTQLIGLKADDIYGDLCILKG